MKKAILIVAALILVVSGVAAVSAYEAHTVNVKAKVENAIGVSVEHVDFGIVFPEEWLSRHFDVVFSTSWYEQAAAIARDTVDFQIWAKCKPLPDEAGYYPWLGTALYIELPGTTPVYGYVGPRQSDCPSFQKVMDWTTGNPLVGTLETGDSTVENPAAKRVNLWLDAPVFEEYYYFETDVDDKPRGGTDGWSWADAQLKAFLGAGAPPDLDLLKTPSLKLSGVSPHGYEMGIDLIIQVVDIR